MSRLLKIAIGLCFMSLALSGHANRSASVTVSFSVYLPEGPIEDPIQESFNPSIADHSADLNQCELLLRSAERANITTCLEQQTLYTWRVRGKQTFITIAPI